MHSFIKPIMCIYLKHSHNTYFIGTSTSDEQHQLRREFDLNIPFHQEEGITDISTPNVLFVLRKMGILTTKYFLQNIYLNKGNIITFFQNFQFLNILLFFIRCNHIG